MSFTITISIILPLYLLLCLRHKFHKILKENFFIDVRPIPIRTPIFLMLLHGWGRKSAILSPFANSNCIYIDTTKYII